MITCVRAQASGQIPIMRELLHEVDASAEPGILRDTPRRYIRPL